MRSGRDKTVIGRVLVAVLLSGLLLVVGATGAGADGYGSDGDSHYGSTYPVPGGPAGAHREPPPPPVLARTGSGSGLLVAAGLGVLAVGGGLALVARKRTGKASLTPV
jgi:LPXTG-motif cell wall-anchored protein